MQWIAPSAKDAATDTLEKRLWDAADQFRANSGLKAQEYSGPILGLIFLRFAEVRFAAQRAKLEKLAGAGHSSRRSLGAGGRLDDPTAYNADGILYLTPNARFDHLLALPEAADIGKAVNEAMRDIEKHNPQLAGVLPKTYNLFTSTLLKELLKKVSEIPASLDYDAFGRIYEYFLGEFAMTEGQGGGEFYTPASIVRLLTEVIEPYHGRILDPACGSGGMFVSSARFVAEHKGRRLSAIVARPTPSTPALLPGGEGSSHYRGGFDFSGLKARARELRKKQTPAEELLWELLRDRQCYDLKFRRQHQFGDYLLDFYCHELKLAVELDGEPHSAAARQKKDAKRDAYLKSQGVTSLRFENRVAIETPEVILEAIARHAASSSPSGRGGDEGAPPDYSGDPARELSIHGVEKTDDTGRLCRMNLAVHGLEGDIRHGGNVNSYYDDPFDACRAEPSPAAARHPLPLGEGRGEGHEVNASHGRFDFVLANPPFNVNGVDKERLKESVGPGRRFPFGLPRTDNANYLWIQLFYSALNENGRSGSVMANSASDARSSEQEIRCKLIESHAVDVMIAVGPNMFYTVTLPCTLWFMDKAKASLPPRPPSPESSPMHCTLTPASPKGRGDGRGGFHFQGLAERARELRKRQTPAEETLWQLLRNRQLAGLKFRRQHQIGDYLVDFFCAEHGLVVELDGTVHDAPDRKKVDAKRDAYLRTLGHTVIRFPNSRVFDDTEKLLAEIVASIPSTSGRGTGEGLTENMPFDYRGARYSDTILFIDARHIFRQIDRAHRDWTPAQIGFLANIVQLYRGEQPDYTLGGDEAKAKVEELFAAQPLTQPDGHPSPSSSPFGRGRGEGAKHGRGGGGEGIVRYRDIPGLCKVATLKEIEAQGWSLNPGRYVGVAAGEVVSDEDFKEQLETLNEELETLNAQARELETTIAKNVAEILET